MPGVAIDSFKLGVSIINIRGMSADYTLVLVDGKRVSPSKSSDANGYNPTAGIMPPISMIERVEVIRGPASLKYGSEAMGGVINIITKKMPDKTTASISLESRFQEHRPTWGNTMGFNGSIFHPINDKISINLRGKVSQSEQNQLRWKDDNSNIVRSGYPTNRQCRTMNGNCANPYVMFAPGAYQVASVGGRLNYLLNEQNSFYLDSDFTFQRLNSLNTSPMQFTEIRDYEQFNVLLNHDGEYSFGNFNTYVQYNTMSRITHNYLPQAANGAYNTNYGAISGKRDHGLLLYNPTYTVASTWTKNFELGDFGGLVLNAGPSYFYERLYNRENKTDFNGYQVAVFGEGEYLPNEYFGVNLGARVNYAQTYGAYVAPRAYVSVYPTSWLTLKAGVAGGFQVPDLETRYDGLYETGNAYYSYGNPNLQVEKSYNYELALLLDSSFANFSATGYFTNYSDAINTRTFQPNESMPAGFVCDNAAPLCQIKDNVGKAQLWGAEVALNSKALLSSLFIQWGGGIFVDLSYAYTDTEQKSGKQKGKPLNAIPLHSLSSKLSYKTKNSSTYLSYKGLLKKTTEKLSPATGFAIPKYYKDIHIVDLGTNYRFDNGITLGFMINNLLDKDFTQDYIEYSSSTTGVRSAYGTMLPGRNYWLNISADF